jgi:flagellar hook assembly protein FlgD
MGSVSLVSLEIDENVIDISLTAPVQIRGVPSQTALFQNSPNPFNPVTTIGFTVGQNADSVPLTLTLFSTGGQEVVRLVDGPLQPGYHELLWDGRDSSGRPAASGIYLYRLTTPHGAQVRRMLLMR